MKMFSSNSRILHVFIVISILFSLLIASLTWFELHGKTPLMTSTYNKRLQAEENEVLRGSILDANGEILAFTKEDKDVQSRIYPFKNLYTHIIGYDSETYGKTLLEAKYNDDLLGRGVYGLIGKAESLISGEKRTGNSLHLTIDHALQQTCRKLLGKSSGAIVAINPKTGQILAMVSTPDFDPNDNQLSEKWEAMTQDITSPFLPRATKGLYPPGSTFKVVTAIAAIEKGLEDTTFNDAGTIVIDGKTFANYGGKAHGELDLTSAMTVSSNVYFSQLGGLIGAKDLITNAENAGIDKNFDFDLSMTKSRIGSPDMGKTELAATAIGQGKLMVTPLQMAMITAGIANEGIIMKPYLLNSISDASNNILGTTQPEKLYRLTDLATALDLTNMMVEVVKSGTGRKAQIGGTTVAGKTGTAQNEKSSLGDGYDHAWFIGFAPASNPQIAVSVILEYQGKGGGQAAAPIARLVMAEWLNSQLLKQ